MDRRYYLAKLSLIVIAVGLAVAGGKTGTGAAHLLKTQVQSTAAAQMQDAAWQATQSVARTVTCFVSHALQATR